MIKKWFTLLELILVISIIAIIFLISRSLFVNPNQDFISSEICINTINGKLSTFFYEGITGKDQIDNDSNQTDNDSIVTISPIKYMISIESENFKNRIWLTAIDQNGEIINIYWYDIKDISNCETSKYKVILTGTVFQSNSQILITLNKNLSSENGGPGMTICSWTWAGCISRPLYAATIDYLVCPKVGWTPSIEKCKHTLSTKFETATQSLKINKCLDVSYVDATCKKWSNDNF